MGTGAVLPVNAPLIGDPSVLVPDWPFARTTSVISAADATLEANPITNTTNKIVISLLIANLLQCSFISASIMFN
jgi:hypothetical protein